MNLEQIFEYNRPKNMQTVIQDRIMKALDGRLTIKKATVESIGDMGKEAEPYLDKLFEKLADRSVGVNTKIRNVIYLTIQNLAEQVPYIIRPYEDKMIQLLRESKDCKEQQQLVIILGDRLHRFDIISEQLDNENWNVRAKALDIFKENEGYILPYIGKIQSILEDANEDEFMQGQAMKVLCKNMKYIDLLDHVVDGKFEYVGLYEGFATQPDSLEIDIDNDRRKSIEDQLRKFGVIK